MNNILQFTFHALSRVSNLLSLKLKLFGNSKYVTLRLTAISLKRCLCIEMKEYLNSGAISPHTY